MVNPVSLETFQNNTKKAEIAMYFIIALMLIGAGATFAGKGGGINIVVGLVMIGAGGAGIGLKAYNMLVNPKYERKCDDTYFKIYTNLKVPPKYVSGDAEVDTDLDITRDEAVSKVQFGTYGGVFLKSNTSSDSIGGNYDAWYIPGGVKTVLSSTTVGTGDTKADYVYVIKAAKDKSRAITLKTDAADVNARTVISDISPVPTTDIKNPCYSTE